MLPRDLFQHCPRCGAPRSVPGQAPARPAPGLAPENPSAGTLAQLSAAGPQTYACAACGFLYFFNPCCAVAGFLFNPAGEILLLRRAKEPARGQLAVPGGFIDIGETAEAALARETLEEVGLTLRDPQFLCSEVNAYLYRDVTYPVLDLFFTAQAVQPERAAALDGVDGFAWQKPETVRPEDIAFPSIRAALRTLLARRNG